MTNTMTKGIIIAALALVTIAAAVGLVLYISGLAGKPPVDNNDNTLAAIIATQERAEETEPVDTQETSAAPTITSEPAPTTSAPPDTTAPRITTTIETTTMNVDEPENVPSLEDLIIPKPENTQPPVTTQPITTTEEKTTKPSVTTTPPTTTAPATTTKPETEDNGFPSNPKNGDIHFDDDGNRYLYDPWMGWIPGDGETHLEEWDIDWDNGYQVFD